MYNECRFLTSWHKLIPIGWYGIKISLCNLLDPQVPYTWAHEILKRMNIKCILTSFQDENFFFFFFLTGPVLPSGEGYLEL